MKLHPLFEQIMAPYLKPIATRNDAPEPDYDPTPWCAGCGAMRKSECDCGPLAEND